MKKVFKLARRAGATVARPFVAAGRFVRAGFGTVCGKLGCTGACGEVGRTASAGALLFAVAAAGLGARGGFYSYSLGNTATGAAVQVGWGHDWVVWALAGAAAGAAFGALLAFAARRLWSERGAAATLLTVGALGGVLAGGTWGHAVARERVLEVRAQHAATPIAAAPTLAAGQKFSRVNGGVRLTGTVGREVNVVLFGFMLLSGTVVGVLAARGLASPGQGPVAPPPGGFPVVQPNKKR